MTHKLLLLLGFLLPMSLCAQPLTKHFVQFTDKNDSPYSFDQPEAFLSPRALERRRKQGIALDSLDLPVHPNYLNAIRKAGGVIYTTSKWFNAATVYCPDETVLAAIQALPFVKSTEPTGRNYPKRPIPESPKTPITADRYTQRDAHYGFGRPQIEMLNGDLIHRMGYTGEGMLVAVLDGGFTNVDIMPFFDSLRTSGRLLPAIDLVDADGYAYEASSHGSQVLSTMASNLSGLMIGTAPGATYVCIKTEDVRSELRIEEDNWVAGAEYADSLGVDVLNSSLGYTSFNIDAMSHQYSELDGNTTRVTIGADIAAQKGILVVVSAGNEGYSAWKYLGAPADADSVLAVGATDVNGRRVGFSSVGPTADGRIKPNVMAQGGNTIVASLYKYGIMPANGTSFSGPVMAGMVTALWQAFPEKSNMEIIRAVEMSADRYDNPDNQYGHGMPDFYKAYQILSGDTAAAKRKTKRPGLLERELDALLIGSSSGEVRKIKP